MKHSSYLESLIGSTGDVSPLRSILFDGVTGLPTLPLVIESLKDVASEQNKIGIIFVDTTGLEPLEQEHGWESLDMLLNQVRVFLDSIVARFAPLNLFSIHRVSGDDFILVLSSNDPSIPISNLQVAEVSNRLQELLNDYLCLKMPACLLPFARVFSGHALLEYNTNLRFERLLSRSINKAFQIAVSNQLRARECHVHELQEIVDSDNIRTLFQPIVSLENPADILGHEALSRGPEGSPFETAEFMFTLAAQSGILPRLENLCQLQLLSVLRKCASKKLIFINLEPSFLEHDLYQRLALFQHPDLDRRNLVLEITERVAITDYEIVAKALDAIRALGFRIAVDDVGSGYASLQSIAYLKPDFIKVSEKMVQGISKDFIKQEIVKTLRDMGGRFSATLIAEGIEDERDLRTLQELKVQFGQGFLLKRPDERLLG